VLRRRGFKKVIQVEGGIKAWEKNGFETVRN
jgi:rhodanese-related sulfurtransferase